MVRPHRVPESSSAPASEAEGEELRVPLRLTIARGALGLELYEPVEFGPLTVQELSVTLPNLKFPVDLSGGVRLFRHRRGRLLRVRLALRLDLAARFLERRAREILGGLVRPVSVWRTPSGIGVGAVGAGGAVAFELLWAPVRGDARLVVARARGAGLDGPALAVALTLVDTAVGRSMTRTGRIVTLANAGAALGRAVMPSVGARAPSAEDLSTGPLEGEGDVVQIALDTALPPVALPDDVVRALELAELVRAADDDLARGDPEAARAGYVAALESAPRHPEICRLVAEIDAFSGSRAEAALSLLTESLPLSETGTIGAMLLSRVGDHDGAREALLAATRAEEYAPVAALLFCQQAEHSPDAAARAAALSEAVARCPALPLPRWRRFEARLALGDVAGAVSDAEHLEASATGKRARHEVCARAGAKILSSGYPRDGGKLFERALRYLPDDAEATAGLGRSLVEAGRSDRAVALLERAITLGTKAGRAPASALLDLGRILAKLGDLPQAIARVREVAAPSPEVVEARALEAEFREKIGDLTGASLAHARLRETVELSPPEDPARAVDFLRKAARFEWDVQRDARAVERHLAVALRLMPRDRAVGDLYREASARLAAQIRKQAADAPE